MNKSLVNEYRAEFEYWLSGAPILVRYYDYEDGEHKEWKEVDDKYNWDDSNIYKPQFIRNDKYVEFRKALFDKTKKVEVKVLGLTDWFECKKKEFQEFSNYNEYRIVDR